MKSSKVRVFEKGSLKNKSNFEEKELKKRKKRPNLMDSEKLKMLLEVYYTKPYSLRQLATMFGVSRMTVWRTVQQYSYIMR